MLTELNVENYKCFKENKHFPLSSINLFTGLNGRGKSSVLQPILLLSQSVINTNSLKDLLVSSSWLRLGDFNDIKSSSCSLKDSITFGFKTNLEKINSFEFEYIEKKGTIDKGTLKSFALNGEKSSEETISGSTEGIDTSPEEEASTSINYQDDARILKIFRNVHYVSADREGPKLYVDKFGVIENERTGIHGEKAINLLSTYKEALNPIYFMDGIVPNNLLELCEVWMNYIFEGVKMKLNDNADSSVLSLNYNSQENKYSYKAVNVGFGYSYILSLVVTCLIAKEDDIVIFENPEAHLHPKAQSRLTHLLMKLVQNKVQLFLESHSEHILNGFRVGVANKDDSFSNEMLSVFYFGENFSIVKLNVQPDGFIENWPSGFFDQSELDLTLLFQYSREKK